MATPCRFLHSFFFVKPMAHTPVIINMIMEEPIIVKEEKRRRANASDDAGLKPIRYSFFLLQMMALPHLRF